MLAVLVLVVGLLGAPLAHAAPPAEPAPHTMTEVTFYSHVLGTETTFAIYLPAEYSESKPKSGYPVLYALHGTGPNHLWLEETRFREFSAGRDVVFVAPRSCTLCNNSDTLTVGDAYIVAEATTPDGSRRVGITAESAGVKTGTGLQWERFFVEELLPYVQSHYNVRTDRAGRGVFGVSNGGVGSGIWMTRHPDLFAFAAPMSGAFNWHPNAAEPGISALGLALSGTHGDPVAHEWRWRDVMPWDNAPNLVGVPMRIVLTSGDGSCDGQSPPQGAPIPVVCDDAVENGTAEVERWIYKQTVEFHGRLEQLGVSSLLLTYPDVHTYAAVNAAMGLVLEEAEATFAASLPARPASFDYQNMSREFSIWGYDIEVRRPNHEFLYLKDVTADGMRLLGTGSASITTPPLYKPGETYSLTVTGPDATATRAIRADGDGRLFLQVRLGPDRLVNYHQALVDQGAFPFPETTVRINGDGGRPTD